MFTGIIQAVGSIAQLNHIAGDVRIRVQTGKLDMIDVALGDSIATNGICLTVIEYGPGYFVADVSAETLRNSTLSKWSIGTAVNLEKALLPTTRLGGHIVSGHVDAVGIITLTKKEARSIYFEITAPESISRYMAHKGSITVDGISLTVNKINGSIISLNLVPHTAEFTNIGHWKTGAEVNLEVDVLARYLERLMTGPKDEVNSSAKTLSMDTLRAFGYIK